MASCRYVVIYKRSNLKYFWLLHDGNQEVSDLGRLSGQGKIHVSLCVTCCASSAEGVSGMERGWKAEKLAECKTSTSCRRLGLRGKRTANCPKWLTVGDNGTHQPHMVVH